MLDEHYFFNYLIINEFNSFSLYNVEACHQCYRLHVHIITT